MGKNSDIKRQERIDFENIVNFNAVSSGSYIGKSTVNEPIAHGLGVKPSMVMIFDELDHFCIIQKDAGLSTHGIFGADPYKVLNYAVTVANKSAFYVGNADAYYGSMNAVGEKYKWVAYR